MAPKQIDRYEIIKELGRGGMASVYLARDPRFGREVAVKILPAQFTHDPQFRKRFEREAKTIAGLDHAAIVPVYDFGEFENQPYLVMRHMAGGSLAERIPKKGLPLEDVLPIILRIAPALDKAHRQGIIHRDLKPGNILFDSDDKAYVADFGVVKLAEASASLTMGVIGTPEYMSPEQGEGKAQLDGRSDVYALGVIVYQLLAGKLPYQADTPMSVIYAHLHEPLPDIRAVKPDLPKGIKAVLEKALAKERNNRYPTARDFALALARAASTTVPKAAEMLADAPETEVVDVGEETRAEEKPLQGDAGQREAADKTVRLHDLDKPQPAPERKFNMPRWGWLAGGGVIILLLLARGLSGNIPAILANETPGATLTSTPASTRTITPVPFGGGNRILFVSDRDGNAEIYLMNADGSDAINLTNHIGEDTAPQWSPDGSRILFKSSRDGGSDLFVMNADGSEITNLTNPFFDDEAFPIWSPDSSRILFTVDLDGDRDIFTIEVDSGRLTNLIDNTVDDFGSVWSPDGSQIAFGSTRSGDGDLFVMDADGGNVLQLTQNKRIGGPVWSPDGARIAYTIFLSIQNPSSLSIGLIDADGGNGVEIETGSGIPFRKFWTPDGSALFAHMVSGLTGLYTLFISADGSEETELPGELAEIGAVSPDGSQVAYVAAGDGVDFLNLYELDSANERTLVELAEEASSLQWSPDGGYILFLAGEESEAEIFVVDVQSGELVQITDNQVEESAPSWLP